MSALHKGNGTRRRFRQAAGMPSHPDGRSQHPVWRFAAGEAGAGGVAMCSNAGQVDLHAQKKIRPVRIKK
jgi:hypothetical protein